MHPLLSGGPPPVIGIVMAAYNAEKFIEETLRSIQGQTFTDWICLCVDDGSKDGTARVIEKLAAEDGRFHLVSQSNAGPCVARNKGFHYLHPETPLVCFADADDLWEPNFLEVLNGELEAHPAAIGAYALARYIDPQGQPTHLDWVPFPDQGRDRVAWRDGRVVPLAVEEPATFFSLAVKSRVFPPGCVLVRRRGFDKVGLFDPDVWMLGDWDMWLRLSRAGELRMINQVLVGYRQHESSMTNSNPRNAVEVAYLTSKAVLCPGNSPEQTKAAIAGYRYREKGRLREKLDRIKQWRQPLQSAKSLAQTAGHLARIARGIPGRRG